MTRFFSSLIVFGTVCGLLSPSMNLLQAGDKDDNPVKIKHVAAKPDSAGNQKVTFTLTIDKGWHIYANPVGDDMYAPNATQIKAKGATIKVEYPKGKVKTLDDDGTIRNLNVYMDQVTIVAEIARTGNAAVEFTVRYNACDKDKCLATATKKIRLE